MTSTGAQTVENNPATITAYRYFKNTGVVKQEWFYDCSDKTHGDVYTTFPVSPHEIIQPFKYKNELHLTPESALEAAIKAQESEVRSAQAKLDREQGMLEHLNSQQGQVKVTEPKF